MKTTSITLYHVDGAEMGLQGLTPLVTRNREKAEDAERILYASSTDGRLSLALSDQFVYGRDGVHYPGGFRLYEGYHHWSNLFDSPAVDSVDKLVGRCRCLQELMAREEPEVFAVLHAAVSGYLNALGSYHVTVYRGDHIVPCEETVLVAATEHEARGVFLRRHSGWEPEPSGDFLNEGVTYKVELTCTQQPRCNP